MIYLRHLQRQYNTFITRILSLLAITAIISYTEVMERIDFVIYDAMNTLQPSAKDTDLVIVAIDDTSIRELGGWPWSRGVHAELINRLTSIGNQTTAFDLLFSELQANDPHADQLLSEAIAAHGHIIFPVAPVVSTTESNLLTLAMPHPLFSRHAALGHTDIELDSDAIARRVFLHAGINMPVWPALGLLLAEKMPLTKARSPDQERMTKTPLPSYHGRFWARTGEVLIPFTGKPGSFPQISYSRVLFDDDVLASLKDKAVIIGMTATGMGTRFATPASLANRQPMTGVEWHANIYSMIQHNRMIHPASSAVAILITLSWVTLILVVTGALKNNFTILSLLALLLLTLILGYLSLHLINLWIPPGAALFGVIASYPLWNWYRINQFLRSFLINKIQSTTALETIGDGVIITDASDHVIYINRGAENILRTQLNQATGKLLRQIVHIEPATDCTPADQNSAVNPESGLDTPGTLECQIKTALNDRRNVRITRNQLHDEKRVLIGSVISMTDITDTVRLTQRVAFQEEYDALTKLPNRAKLLSRFDQLIRLAEEAEKTITVFFVTLDNFKKINDAMGHQAGDKLLRIVSRRLDGIADQHGVIARWGGDEFIILLDHLGSSESVAEVAQKILRVIEQHFEIDGMRIFVSASIGISFYPQDGVSSNLVLEKAGTAMYQAKREGGNRFDFYSPQSSVIWTRDRLELEKDLRTAIEHNELQVFFQPIVNVVSNKITHIEALVRWQHPERGFLPPSEFVPLAENIGLIGQLGERVLSISCVFTNQLLQAGYPVKVSVNVNPRQLTNPEFLETVFKILQETGLPSSTLMLEITESAIVNNTERASEILAQIKAVGIQIALDDFGTGYSSLTLLRELPIDILKIDKSFVRTLDQNQNDQKIVQAIIGLGANLGLTVVAEGVETEQQSRMLLQHHCRYQQGYFFSRPVPYPALLELITKKMTAGKQLEAG
ncbi:MAG: EAL domain-containing protein [Nitrosomonas sp.]|nr:EAL domain-containing protein [Nitrosomonas sp.]